MSDDLFQDTKYAILITEPKEIKESLLNLCKVTVRITPRSLIISGRANYAGIEKLQIPISDIQKLEKARIYTGWWNWHEGVRIVAKNHQPFGIYFYSTFWGFKRDICRKFFTVLKKIIRPLYQANFTDSDVLYKIGIRKDGTIFDRSPTIECPNCSRINAREASECKYCKTTFQKCEICDGLLGKNETVFCPNCNAGYHKAEFLEWLKVKAHCKACNFEIDLWELQRYILELDKVPKPHCKVSDVEIGLPKFCHKCKNKNPFDAHFAFIVELRFKDIMI